MFGNDKSSGNSRKKSNTVNSFKTKNSDNTKHNNDRVSAAGMTGRKRTLPELPKRERYNGNYRYTNTEKSTSQSRYSSSYGYYGMNNKSSSNNSGRKSPYSANGKRTDRDYYTERTNIHTESKKKTESRRTGNKAYGAADALGSAIGGVSQLVKGSKRSNSRIVNNKSVSAKRNSVALPIFIFFIVLCFIYIIGSSVNFLTKKIVNYDVLSYGTIDTPKSASALVIRNEKVYNTDKTGVISYNIADNEKVKKGTVVCSVKDEAVVAQMQASLDDINEQIMKIQSERKDISVYSEDIKKYNLQMKDIIDESALD